ncbi:biopolymer transporter ExbD [Psychrosphaera sp. B3R10]|uniref:Biopolymer transporter ExbD n=1 Tax=Psychrosphaera algicola TaxID=3023714 RepID=A0ABT5FII9_9GAMM|nr:MULTISPECIES: biopolymer transporter ExbD [unclassified Psychrosphaera]MBU2883486.1 biopolymer transporter ExbD [Psychrosphaera sp. I2R16]MBU2990342.1 biopolymer transporter ExbD [Psychrosphaera sp. B3R10]MDC2891013.1 biopolymer transporter ExbD [Psychrosphaera sp. G1-22]MDO6718722.1 biopolymer transporter ExbD [Psychrosphaera sp. 1_MG-2023]
MARKQRFREDDDAAIDMTPMLDIVFIMLIFFIVTTSFVKEAGIEVVKPKAAASKPNSKGNIFIAIKANGEVWMDKRLVDIERVAANIERMLAEQPTESIIVQADKESKHGVVVKVMDAIKSAGELKIIIAAEKK